MKNKSKRGFYAMILGGTTCIFGGIGYLLVNELLGSGAAYPQIDEAVELIRNDDRMRTQLGDTNRWAVFGTSDGRRRRPIINKTVDVGTGRQVFETRFYLEGEVNRGRVYLKAVEKEDGSWEKRILEIDIPGHGKNSLISIRGDEQGRSNSSTRYSSNWHPFSKVF